MPPIDAARLAARLDSWNASPRTEKAPLVEPETVDVMAAKVGSAAGVTPTAGAAASALRGLSSQNPVQVSGDVLKLTGEALLQKAPATANNVAAGGHLLSSVAQAAQGDAFYAASAASVAIEKFSPALANSAVGAVANVLVMGASDRKIKDQKQALVKSAETLAAGPAAPGVKTKAALDLGTAASALANFYRAAGNAAAKLGRYGLTLAGKLQPLAPSVAVAEARLAAIGATRFGVAVRLLNKWIPLLNIAGVALSAKTAVDVFRDDRSSTTSKALSVASVGSAGLALAAGITMGALPFFGVVAASVATDLLLARSRRADAEGFGTDAQSRRWLTHPAEAVGPLLRWGQRDVPDMARETARSAIGQARRWGLPERKAPVTPDRVLVR